MNTGRWWTTGVEVGDRGSTETERRGLGSPGTGKTGQKMVSGTGPETYQSRSRHESRD